MTAITVRRMQFDIPQEVDLYAETDDPAGLSSSVALSLSLPYLEPYLIRTMKVALDHITDPELAEDVRRFSAQEGHHFRAHAQFNRWIKGKLPPERAAEIETIEAALEADYQRFTATKSLRFNLAYAEGFEAMTCSFALATLEAQMPPSGPRAWQELFEWHLAEEIEHRTVAFEAFDHVVGSYPYRIVFGTYAQFHFLRYIGRFFGALMRATGQTETARPKIPRPALRRWLRTYLPTYSPRKIVVPPGLDMLLARYSDRAA